MAQIVVQRSIYKQFTYAKVINLAGRQRMLSQRLVKLILLQKSRLVLVEGSDILQVKNLILKSHQTLTLGSENIAPAFTPKILKKYEQLNPLLRSMDESINCLFKKCRPYNEILTPLNSTLDDFLFKMNRIVDDSEKFAREQLLFLNKLELSIFTLLLLVFSFEFFKIIIPLKDFLIQQISDLKEKDKTINHQSKLASIGEMAASVGHEINNPLAIVVGNVSLIKKGLNSTKVDKTEIIKKVNKIEDANERIRRIVDGLRTFARIDTEEMKAIPMREAVDKTIDLISELYERDGIKIIRDIDKPHLFANGNIGKVQQIVMNFISNARDATKGQENREIRCSLKPFDQSRLIFSVKDNGTGMSEQVKARVLDPFFTTKAEGFGTGIGLGLVARFVKEMDGEIKIETKLGAGSTFSIILPSVDGTALEQKEEQEKEKNNNLKGIALVVDDEEGIREILIDHLEDLGLAVEEAEDGDLALELVKKKKYDYICTDMRMKRMQGMDFIKKARKLPNGNTGIFIITGGLTTDYSSGDRQELKRIADGYITKPFSEDSIYEVLSKYKSM